MKRRYPSVWLSMVILLLALMWRMVGAPVTAEQFQSLETSLWQARIQLPSRLGRIFRMWHGACQKQELHTMTEEQPYSSEPEQESTPVNVYLVQENRLVQMTLEGYVCGVLAAEMPAQYHMEALKAQAVAARTRALRQMEAGGCSAHPGADICTDSAHCQGYATLAQCRQNWQEGYEAYRDRILQAEGETRGQVLTYEGELITVLYHAISGGRTEDAATVFSQSVPYLVSVESSGEEEASGFWQETYLTYGQIAQKLNEAEGTKLSEQAIRRTLSIVGYTDSGRVDRIQIGNDEMTGVAFRRALGLRSTWFSISTDENGVTFQQRGYGHGVGMSQVGANSMAADGASYAQVLAHYYPGTQIDRR